MPGISSSSTRPAAMPANTLSATASTSTKIGSHNVDQLLHRVAQRLDADLEKIFIQVKQANEPSKRISEANACMIATLQIANSVLTDSGIPPSPHKPILDGVEELVKKTAGMVLNNLENRHRIRSSGTQEFMPAPSFDPDQITLHLDDLESLQNRLSNNDLSPFASVPRHQRWRMCLDPDKVNLIETHVDGARDNPLLPFMFDSTPGYLHGVLNGWQTSMTNLRSCLNADLICSLHDACYLSGQGYGRQTRFQLFKGSNMTSAGAQQLKAFARELRKTLPEYAVVPSDTAYQQFIKAREDRPDAEPADFVNHALLVRPGVPFSRMKELIGAFVDEYNTQRTKNPKASSIQRQAQAIALCQKLEQLHPFPDANARSFAILLLNHLLARDGQPLTMLGDPNILDGWSTEEVMKELGKGQERVIKWSAADSDRHIQLPSKKGSSRLNRYVSGFFKKKT